MSEGDPPTVRRRLTDWQVVALTAAVVLGVLMATSYNADRSLIGGIGWRYLQGVLLLMGVFALFTMGLNLEFGHTGLINFGHVVFLGIGAYTAAVLTWRIGARWDEAGIIVAAAAIIAIVGVAVVLAVALAMLLGIPTLRLREDYLAITTIGAAEVLRITWLNEEWLTNGAHGLSVRMPGATRLRDPEGVWGGAFAWLGDTTGIDLNPYHAFLLLALAASGAGIYVLLERLRASPWGRVVRAVRENEDVAAALGKDVFAIKLQSLAIGSAVAAIAGVFFAWYQSFINPETFLPLVTFYAWIVLVVGGTGNHRGVIAGSVIVWGIFEVSRQLDFLEAVGLASTAGPQQVLFIGIMLVLFMLFRPWGILGDKEELRLA